MASRADQVKQPQPAPAGHLLRFPPRSIHARMALVLAALALVVVIDSAVMIFSIERFAPEEDARSLETVVLGLALGSFAVMALLWWRAGYKLARRIDIFARGARQIAAGDLDARIAVKGPAEIRIAAAEFNAMAERLQRADEATREREQQLSDINHTLRALIETSPTAIVALDVDGNVTTWNPAAERLFGWTAREIAGRPYPLVPEDDREETLSRRRRALAGEPLPGRDARRHRKDGTLVNVHTSVAALRDAGGRPYGVVLLMNDVTERKRAEENLRTYADIVDSMQIGLDVWRLDDPDDAGSLRLVISNAAAGRFAGRPRIEVLGRTIAEVYPNLLATPLPGMFADVVRKQEPRDFGDIPVDVPGLPRGMFAAKAFPLPDNCVGIAFEDVTARRHMEHELQESQERLRTIMAAAPLILVAVDGEGVVTLIEGRGLARFGLAAGELVGQSVFRNWDGNEDVAGPFKRALAGQEFEGTLRFQRAVLDAHLAPLRDAGGRVVGAIGVAMDVTERRQTEEELRQRTLELTEINRTLSALVDTSPVGIVMLDLDDRVLLWNPAAERLFGWTASEVIGRPYPLVPAGDREERLARRQRVLAGEAIVDNRTQRLRKDGTPLDVSMSAAALADASGHVYGSVVLLNDASERKRALELEIRLLAAQISEQAKSDVLSTVSHELRTPLTAIQGYLSVVLRYGDRLSGEEATDFLKGANQAARHLERLVNDLLTISRLDAGMLDPHLERVDVAGLVTDLVRTERLIWQDREYGVSMAAGCSEVRFDPLRLRQVVANLLDNARKYSPESTPIEIEIACEGDDRLRVTVRDYGIGVPPDELDSIFGRFHRVKSPETAGIGGAGLGLAICKGIVETHGGTIAASLPPDGGLAVSFTIPVTPPAPGGETPE